MKTGGLFVVISSEHTKHPMLPGLFFNELIDLNVRHPEPIGYIIAI
jgi:hypothetical protein